MGPFRLELLVPPGQAQLARVVLEGYDWTYQLGSHGHGGILPVHVYSWALAPYRWRQAPVVELRWGVEAIPPTFRASRQLGRFLWTGARSDLSGWSVPDAESLAVYLAMQAARDPTGRQERLLHLADCLSEASWDRTEQIATRCGVRDVLRWAAYRVRRSPDRPPLPLAWRARSFLATRARPRWLRPRISGVVGFGTSPVRCRFGGVEVLAGPGSFVPEVPSERLVRLALEILAPLPDPVVVEPGTGAGAISLAIAAGHRGASVHAIEKHRGALRWAKRSVRRTRQRRVRLYRGSLLDPLSGTLTGQVALIVANLPYVPSTVWSAEGRFVRQAIRGQGDDGLGLYRQLIRQAVSVLQPGGYLVLEMGPYQVEAFRSEATALGYFVERVEEEVLGAVVVIARLGRLQALD